MSSRRWAYWLLVAALLGFYGYRTVDGVRGGWAFARGHLLRNLGNYPGAVPRLESGAVGGNKLRALRMAAEVRLDMWERQVRRRGTLGADPEELVRAGEGFLTCRCIAPAARRSWKGIGEVYDAFEWIGRERRAVTPYVPPENPWSRVGRPGRVAVGMLRVALDTSPNWGVLHDKLALTLWNYGLDAPAREAVRKSAQVLPVFYRHPYYKIPELPEWVVEEFALASREVLGEVPLFPRIAHLIDLGKLERRIGANDRAIDALEEALAAGGDPLRRAEASFHLGLALVAAGRHDEGRTHLNAAREHPVFRVSALRSLANAAENGGKFDEALDYLRRLRWEQPGELWPCLKFAEVAEKVGDWPAALESLRWAKLKHPRDPRPYVALAKAHMAMGDATTATTVADELQQVVGDEEPVLINLRSQIKSASRTSRESGS
jgi:tetratricopeptide (TPR) repeat protein